MLKQVYNPFQVEVYMSQQPTSAFEDWKVFKFIHDFRVLNLFISCIEHLVFALKHESVACSCTQKLRAYGGEYGVRPDRTI